MKREKIHKNVWDIVKTALRGKFIALTTEIAKRKCLMISLEDRITRTN